MLPAAQTAGATVFITCLLEPGSCTIYMLSLAARLRIDPAVISGPVMSTLVDATVLFVYFSLAHLIINI